jgi:hypothetical protein
MQGNFSSRFSSPQLRPHGSWRDSVRQSSSGLDGFGYRPRMCVSDIDRCRRESDEWSKSVRQKRTTDLDDPDVKDRYDRAFYALAACVGNAMEPCE